MNRIFLCIIFIVTGALLLSITNAYSHSSYCSSFTGTGCNGCHPTPGTGGQPSCPNPDPTCIDKDGDGYGNPGDASCTYAARDCNDNNASINPGAVENCTDGIDNDCDQLIDSDDPSAVNCPLNCTDIDQDGYNADGGACGPVDCVDNNEFINPGVQEDCTDGIDNDCDNLIDGADPDCPAEFCGDYGSDRRRCNADPRCEYSGKSKSCSEIDTNLLDCKEKGGRWSRRTGGCVIRQKITLQK